MPWSGVRTVEVLVVILLAESAGVDGPLGVSWRPLMSRDGGDVGVGIGDSEVLGRGLLEGESGGERESVEVLSAQSEVSSSRSSGLSG